ALTMRVRNVYSAKEPLGKLKLDLEDLAKPEFKGKICTRSGKHPYNIAMVASMIAHHGEADTKVWLEGLKGNLARRPQGNDRSQVKAVKEGLCDIAIGNSYYLGKMLADPKQRVWAEAVEINFTNQDDRGAHINISGMALTKHAPNKAAAVKLMEYLSSDRAQASYAELNFEYPVKADVPVSELIASWGEFKADSLAIQALADNHRAAVRLLDEVKFDL
ncbi:MAG: extracellular solute-binding protein, partial [Shewanella sp.]|nr:extracellular solute-binding protein [Shewanella sp.]